MIAWIKAKLRYIAGVALALAAAAWYYFSKRSNKAVIKDASIQDYKRSSDDAPKPVVEAPLTEGEIDEELNKLRNSK